MLIIDYIGLRKLKPVDRDAIYEWRNSHIFNMMLNSSPPTYEAHCIWFDNLLNKKHNEELYIILYGSLRIGLVSTISNSPLIYIKPEYFSRLNFENLKLRLLKIIKDL